MSTSARTTAAGLAEAESAQGLSRWQRSLLDCLGQSDGAAMSVGDLAGLVALRHVTLTGLVERLEAKGLLRRFDEASDGRMTQLQLTAKGRRAMSAPPRSVLAAAPAVRRGTVPLSPIRSHLLRMQRGEAAGSASLIRRLRAIAALRD